MYRLLPLVVALAVAMPGSLLAQKDKPADRGSDTKPMIPRVAGKTIQEWIKDLRHTDPSIRREAVQMMPFFGEYSFEAVPGLVYVLSNDVDVSLRVNAAIVLMKVDVRDKDVPIVVKALVNLLEGPNRTFQVALRYHAVVTIGRFGPDAKKDGLTSLINAASDRTSWEIRQAACASLFTVGIDFKENTQDSRAVNAMITLLNDPASKVRLEAIMGLSNMGKLTQANANLRIKLMDGLRYRLTSLEREKTIVVWTYFCLLVNDTETERWLDAITGLLKTGDVPTRLQALQVLGRLGKHARKRFPDMAAAILDVDPWVSGSACTLFALMSKEIQPPAIVLENLKKVEADKDRPKPLQNTAKEALKMIDESMKTNSATGKN